MEQEDKDLLLKDLCARLPYGVKAQYYGTEEECDCLDEIDAIYIENPTSQVGIGQYGLNIDKIKPYLFPLSSMTEEQKDELICLIKLETNEIIESLNENKIGIDDGFYKFNQVRKCDWLNKNHFDYRGLISRGLAIDATGLNIY